MYVVVHGVLDTESDVYVGVRKTICEKQETVLRARIFVVKGMVRSYNGCSGALFHLLFFRCMRTGTCSLRGSVPCQCVIELPTKDSST